MARKKSKLPVVDTASAPVEYKQSKTDIARQRRYEAEDALRTLQRADEVRNNSRLMNDVKSLANEQVKTAKKYCK